jgi:hypothetical protein
MKYSKCRADVGDDSRFCPKCGFPARSEEAVSFSHTRTIVGPEEKIRPGILVAGRYRIIGTFGRGGVGVVYKAEDTKLKRVVALKFLPPEFAQDEEARERFIREAQAAAALDHPNICTVYEVDESEGRTYIAMAFIEGRSLKELLARGPMEIPARILDEMIEARKKPTSRPRASPGWRPAWGNSTWPSNTWTKPMKNATP